VGLYREIQVKKGDVVFVPAGTVHALNDGLVVAEIQQIQILHTGFLTMTGLIPMETKDLFM